MKQKETKKQEKKQKKKKGTNALKTRRVIANNLFVLRLIHSVAPSYLPTYFLWSVANASLSFFLNVWLLREVVNRYSLGRPAAAARRSGACPVTRIHPDRYAAETALPALYAADRRKNRKRAVPQGGGRGAVMLRKP